ncbi:MAG: SMI1/KNR4 family protein [Coprococcus sp.]|nr:SMI1/KNR4 family protein [Coprococcus sp.]
MGVNKNPFQIATYKKIFNQYMLDGEQTQKDECLVDMDEPRGNKISLLPGHPARHTTTCKAFVTTTTNARLLIAVLDIYGKFHECYEMRLEDISYLTIKKAFGGMNISFRGKTQFGFLRMEMYVAKYQFGTDLKEQKKHLQELVSNIQISMSETAKKPEAAKQPEEVEQPMVRKSDKTQDCVEQECQCEETNSENPMKDRFDEIIRIGDILESNGIDFVKQGKGTDRASIQEWENLNKIILPEDYKNFILLADGLSYGMTEIYPLKMVRKCELWAEGYYAIGSFIGDGSLILCDANGGVYYADHVTGIDKTTFKDFIEEWIIRYMIDELGDNGISEAR